jgi:UDP-N-acetylbacillosamine N-acetyltransferase
MSDGQSLIILGFGGHARSIAAVALSSGFNSLLYLDKQAKAGEKFLDFPAIPQLQGDVPISWRCIPGVGDNREREKQCQYVQMVGLELGRVTASNATLHLSATISPGCFVGHHAHIGPSARIGLGCIINTGAVVEHESTVGDFSHVSVNSVLAGRSRVGRFAFVGAGAVIIDGVSVGDNITIGAGSTVTTSLTEPGIYVGSPARLVSQRP